MRNSILSKLSLALFSSILFSLGFSTAQAQDETVTGNLTVEGDADIQGNTVSIGTRSDSPITPGLSIVYVDESSPIINFSASKSAAAWAWRSNTGTTQFQVTGTNTLNLLNPITGGAGVILNPAGTSILAGGLTVNGVFSVPNGAFAGGMSGLILSAGGSGNQNITLMPTGLGSTITASPLTVTAKTPSTNTGNGALTVRGGVGIGGDLNLGGSLNVSGSTVIPTHAGSLILGGAAVAAPAAVTVSGNYAYVVSINAGSLDIVDISDRTAPVRIGTISGGSSDYARFSFPRSVALSGNYAYIASSDSNALEIVDVSNPAAPVHKGVLVDGEGGALLSNPRSVVVSGNYAYVASAGSNALEVVDVSNPAAPVHKGSLIDGAGGALLNYPMSVAVSGNYAYVASAGSNALEIIDIGNPAIPVHKGVLVDGAGGAVLGYPRSVVVSGNNAYVVGDYGFEVVNISNKSAPAHRGALPLSSTSVAVSGSFAYLTSFNNTLEIVDVSDPAAPSHQRSLMNGVDGMQLDGANSVAVAGGYAYVASINSDALEIIDLTTRFTNGYQLNGAAVLSTTLDDSSLLIGAGMPSANVGIGTVTPSARLTVAGTSDSSTESVVNFTDSNSTSLLLITNAGQVGIGTATPSAMLEVNGTVVAAGTITTKTSFRTPPAGDLSMGSFTVGTNPATQ